MWGGALESREMMEQAATGSDADLKALAAQMVSANTNGAKERWTLFNARVEAEMAHVMNELKKQP